MEFLDARPAGIKCTRGAHEIPSSRSDVYHGRLYRGTVRVAADTRTGRDQRRVGADGRFEDRRDTTSSHRPLGRPVNARQTVNVADDEGAVVAPVDGGLVPEVRRTRVLTGESDAAVIGPPTLRRDTTSRLRSA